MVLRKGRNNWVYKKICPRCGELKNVGSKHSRICIDCVMPHYRTEHYVKAKKLLREKEEQGLVKK